MADQTSMLELEIGGMTCAACANRVERKLNKLPGVSAAVNYATERASVTAPEGFDTETLIAAVEAAGYTAALPDPEPSDAPDRLRALRTRLVVAAVLTVPVLLLSMVPALQFDYWQWVALVLAAPVVTWAAWPFHRAAAVNARHGAATMDTLVSLGVLAASAWSLWALLFGGAGEPGMQMEWRLFGSGENEIYLEVATAVTTFLLAGRYLEQRARRESGAALRALLELGAREATVLRDGYEVRVAASDLRVGEHFVVRPGERIAADGIVRDGASAVDQSLVTGESVPVEVGAGDRVIGATINAGGRLVVEATRVGADTELARMGRLLAEAQNGKAQVQRLADRISGVFVPIVLVLSALTFIAWWLLSGDLEAAFTAAIATLIVACPCALGLATPTALLVGTGRGSQLGILIRGPEVLEDTRRVDTVVLDKTGTVTSGRMTVETATADDVLALAAAVEAGSEHPIASAIVDAAQARGLAVPSATQFTTTAGFGASALVEGVTVTVGRPETPDAAIAAAQAAGSTVVVVARGGETVGTIALRDTPKPSSRDAIARFRALGLRPVLLTGDNAGAAQSIAAEVGIDDVRAEVTPAGKLDAIRALQAEGRVVAMVGDGVNDAAALAAADLGVAMGGGTDAAQAASDLTVASGDLTAVADAIRLSRRTLRVIKGNLFWAFGYNVAAIPLAMAGLLNPLIAGAAMALSSVFVVTNSLRLRRFKPLAASQE
ncbi:heavy metal translocating P-type ATPase [Herbiconiux sp. SYSU D00978]|uniref:heavy metal translocating P-type ATPase n=1 Tax=Herbiconiux sp. SYSU D00978 TaxID=2812562 RepID=UPI001A97012D|nr:heavy metal translocating P-type ATPase [Herbiconiux sp. SYSU D00978]